MLSYHVSPDGALEAEDLENNQELSTLLEGQGLVVRRARRACCGQLQ